MFFKQTNAPATRVSKGYHGWSAQTRIPLTETKILRIYTGKNLYNELCTQVSIINDEGSHEHMTMLQGRWQVLKSSKPVFATENAVTAQHESIIKNETLLNSIIDKVRKQYNI